MAEPLQLSKVTRYLTRWIDLKWLMLFNVVFPVFVLAMDSSSLFILLPRLAEEFNTDASTIIWIGWFKFNAVLICLNRSVVRIQQLTQVDIDDFFKRLSISA